MWFWLSPHNLMSRKCRCAVPCRAVLCLASLPPTQNAFFRGILARSGSCHFIDFSKEFFSLSWATCPVQTICVHINLTSFRWCSHLCSWCCGCACKRPIAVSCCGMEGRPPLGSCGSYQCLEYLLLLYSNPIVDWDCGIVDGRE